MMELMASNNWLKKEFDEELTRHLSLNQIARLSRISVNVKIKQEEVEKEQKVKKAM